MVELTLSNSNDLMFQFRVVAPVENSKIQPSLAIPLPNTSAENQLLFRFAGQQEELSFDFVLFPSETDLSNSSAPSGDFPNGVKTVKEQQIYLRDYLYEAQFNVGYFITFPGMYNSFITGNIENISFSAPPSSRNEYRTGRLTFRRGRTQGTG